MNMPWCSRRARWTGSMRVSSLIGGMPASSHHGAPSHGHARPVPADTIDPTSRCGSSQDRRANSMAETAKRAGSKPSDTAHVAGHRTEADQPHGEPRPGDRATTASPPQPPRMRAAGRSSADAKGEQAEDHRPDDPGHRRPRPEQRQQVQSAPRTARRTHRGRSAATGRTASFLSAASSGQRSSNVSPGGAVYPLMSTPRLPCEPCRPDG